MRIENNPIIKLLQTYIMKIDKLNDKERDCFISILQKVDTTAIVIPDKILNDYEFGKLKHYLQENGHNLLLINGI